MENNEKDQRKRWKVSGMSVADEVGEGQRAANTSNDGEGKAQPLMVRSIVYHITPRTDPPGGRGCPSCSYEVCGQGTCPKELGREPIDLVVRICGRDGSCPSQDHDGRCPEECPFFTLDLLAVGWNPLNFESLMTWLHATVERHKARTKGGG